MGSTGRSQKIAEMNIMMIANYSSINLYTKLVLVAELRAHAFLIVIRMSESVNGRRGRVSKKDKHFWSKKDKRLYR